MANKNQAASMAHIDTDPLRNFKFNVQINHPKARGLINMGFMSVQGLNISTEVIPYREGGMNTTTQKMPGQTDFAPITLSRGLAVGNHGMMDWMLELFSVIAGQGYRASGSGPANDFRTTMVINILDHPVTKGIAPVKASFKVYNAWPSSVSWSDLDAGANAIVVNQMTLQHEGFEFKLADTAGKAPVGF
jgi:phage tail-like protein